MASSNTFTTIKSNVRQNLDDAGITFYSVADIDDSTQDAYDDVAALTQCIVKKVTLNFQASLVYYNFKDLVPDFLGCTAIFSNLTNLWLLDDRTERDFDRDRPDWELWTGSAVWWAPSGDYRIIAVVPKQTAATNNFDLFYWASAPVVVDADTPLIAIDMSNLIELYITADLLEQGEEFSKALPYWTQYYEQISTYAERCKNLAKSDLLMLA